jgi:hypothetical protein
VKLDRPVEIVGSNRSHTQRDTTEN